MSGGEDSETDERSWNKLLWQKHVEKAQLGLFRSLRDLYVRTIEEFNEDCDMVHAEFARVELENFEYMLGGMPMSGIMWDNHTRAVEDHRAIIEQLKNQHKMAVHEKGKTAFEYWCATNAAGWSRLELSLAKGRHYPGHSADISILFSIVWVRSCKGPGWLVTHTHTYIYIYYVRCHMHVV